jgi:integrase
VLAHLPFGSDIEKRNRALIAFTLLTGARDNAIASMRLKHVDLVEGKIIQDARQVQAIVTECVTFLQQERLWGPTILSFLQHA